MDEDRLYEHLKTFNVSQFTDLRRRVHLTNAHFSPNATPAELADEVIKQFKQRGDDLAKLAEAAFSVDQENVAVLEPHSPDDGRSQTVYQPAPWEKICVVTTALLVVLLVGFLVVRNLPFHDPIRTVLSVAVAVLGATIPGFLHVDLSTRGLTIRAGGALALFVLSFFFSPSVLPGLSIPRSKSPTSIGEPGNGHHNENKSPSHPAPSKSILAGQFIDKTGKPLADVSVAIEDWETVENKPPKASTDAEGRFRFDNLRPSSDPKQRVHLMARKAGYEPSKTDPLLGTTDLQIELLGAATSGGNP